MALKWQTSFPLYYKSPLGSSPDVCEPPQPDGTVRWTNRQIRWQKRICLLIKDGAKTWTLLGTAASHPGCSLLLGPPADVSPCQKWHKSRLGHGREGLLSNWSKYFLWRGNLPFGQRTNASTQHFPKLMCVHPPHPAQMAQTWYRYDWEGGPGGHPRPHRLAATPYSKAE